MYSSWSAARYLKYLESKPLLHYRQLKRDIWPCPTHQAKSLHISHSSSLSRSNPILYTDNPPPESIASREPEYQRSKHIDARYHFIRDHSQKASSDIHHIPGVAPGRKFLNQGFQSGDKTDNSKLSFQCRTDTPKFRSAAHLRQSRCFSHLLNASDFVQSIEFPFNSSSSDAFQRREFCNLVFIKSSRHGLFVHVLSELQRPLQIQLEFESRIPTAAQLHF